jgi:hypothetical protein
MSTRVLSPQEALAVHLEYLTPRERVIVLRDALQKAEDAVRDPRLTSENHWVACALSPMHGGICHSSTGEPEPRDLDFKRPCRP